MFCGQKNLIVNFKNKLYVSEKLSEESPSFWNISSFSVKDIPANLSPFISSNISAVFMKFPTNSSFSGFNSPVFSDLLSK